MTSGSKDNVLQQTVFQFKFLFENKLNLKIAFNKIKVLL